jgi:YD repeat-containing protein
VEGLDNSVTCSSVLPGGSAVPSGARRITTAWHADWARPTANEVPLRKTTTVYHGQPDPFTGNITANCTSAANLPDGKSLPVVCKQVEQATLSNGAVDTSVPARIVKFTYDAAGRVISSVDANSKTSTYAYFTSKTFSGTGDADLNNVALLLHANGPDGSTAISDSAPAPSAWVSIGNAQISTAESKFGGGSIKFDGNGDYLGAAYSSAFNFGTGDFTVELFARFSSVVGQQVMLTNYHSPTTGWTLQLYNGKLIFNCTGDGIDLQGVAPIATGTWYHVAVARSGSTVRLFINGALDATATNSQDCSSPVGLTVGLMPAHSTLGMNGYLDEIRISAGLARYTSAFTAPTQEFADSGPTSTATGHTVGDLQSITNAAGHVTQFNLYDPAGRVRRMTDPKGVITDISYTPRGWVSTVSVTPPGGSARTTTYTYDNVGQLTGVSSPDGTNVTYAYDAAHRLIGATDAMGNAVAYTLDNVGNRIAEEVRDPTGTLQRSISRSFDALNRLQQVTGAAR